jgi:hypothetical protein
MGTVNTIYCNSCDASARLSTGGGRSQVFSKKSATPMVQSICACDTCRELKTISRPASSLLRMANSDAQQVQSECPDCGDAVRMIFSGSRSGVLGRCPAFEGETFCACSSRGVSRAGSGSFIFNPSEISCIKNLTYLSDTYSEYGI